MKQYVAFARVSSREQEREGFSLEVQEEALQRYADSHGGKIIRFFKIAETASKGDIRRQFRELITFAKKNAPGLDGLLFYKVDRAARNLFDYVELERIESEYNVPFISVSQPTENSPAGRMMRRTLANIASFYTDQQSLDVKEGLLRRLKEGWFIGLAPYGYKNIRKEGRGLVIEDPVTGPNVRRMFELFANFPHTLDSLCKTLNDEGRKYRDNSPVFPRSSVHNILQDRAYIGEIEHRGNWYPGKHPHLVDRATWDRVQALLGSHVYTSHELTYAGERIRCGYCGHFITGERVRKKTKSGDRFHVYYRCSKYAALGHPRIRLREVDLDRQMLAIFDKMRIDDDEVREWVQAVLRSKTTDDIIDSKAQRAELQRQVTLTISQQDKLIEMRMGDEIDADVFARKQTDLRDRLAKLKLQLDVVDRSHDEMCDIASKVFELSQTLRAQWLTADFAAKCRILEIVCLNLVLDGENLLPTMRKPFDLLVEGLFVSSSRGGGI